MTADLRPVLVTGGTGFLARHVAGALRQAGFKVDAPSRRELDVVVSPAPPGDYGTVVHLAGAVGVPGSWTDFGGYVRTNVEGCARVATWCRDMKARLVFASGYVYGIPLRLPIAEDHPVRPNNPYALTKHLAEQVCEFHAQSTGLPVTVLRIFNIYGPGQSQDFLVPTIVRQVLDPASETIRLRDGSPTRDYVHVDDVASAIMAVISLDGWRLFNVGSGTAISVLDIAERLRSAAGCRKPIVAGAEPRLGDIPAVMADIAKISAACGWRPTVGLNEGLSRLIADSGKAVPTEAMR